MKTNWLANIFSWIYEVVEEADRPISLVVMVLLPFIAPLEPAIMTARNLQRFMGLEDYEVWIVAVSFELIGYLGMIAVVGALMRLVKNSNDKLKSALRTNFIFYLAAYVIYIITLISVNIVLEWVNGATAERIVVVACLTVGLSLSAGILNASRIFTRDEKAEDYTIRQEKRTDNLKRTALKQGINVFSLDVSYPESTQNSVKDKGKKFDIRRDEGKLRKDARFILNSPVKDVQDKYGISRKTVYNWREVLKNG